MTVTNFPAGAIAAVVGWVAVVVGETTAFNAFLTNGAVVVGGAVGNTNSLAVGIECCSGRVLTVFVRWTIAVVGARGILFGLHRLTGTAYANAIFTIIIVEADAGGITGVCCIRWIWIRSGGSALAACTQCKD